MKNSKFYSKSLTLLLPILRMIDAGKISSEIADALGMHKSHLHYYIHRAIEMGYIAELTRSSFKSFELTQPGKNFVAMYTNPDPHDTRICRAENIRFKAPILTMPQAPVDWKKVQMRNWDQYCDKIDRIKVHVNDGKKPTIEFIPPPIDGYDPESLRNRLLQECMRVAQELEERLDIRVGELTLSSKGEWLVYDPVAKAYSKQFGQITIDGIGKVNASKPMKRGEFEFFDPRDVSEYMMMPSMLANIEQQQEAIQSDLIDIKKSLKEMGSRNTDESR